MKLAGYALLHVFQIHALKGCIPETWGGQEGLEVSEVKAATHTHTNTHALHPTKAKINKGPPGARFGKSPLPGKSS